MKIDGKDYVYDLEKSTPEKPVYKPIGKRLAKRLERAKRWIF